jgi:hypothetical protein
MISDLIA